MSEIAEDDLETMAMTAMALSEGAVFEEVGSKHTKRLWWVWRYGDVESGCWYGNRRDATVAFLLWRGLVQFK